VAENQCGHGHLDLGNAGACRKPANQGGDRGEAFADGGVQHLAALEIREARAVLLAETDQDLAFRDHVLHA
jgi:hypothetical protein